MSGPRLMAALERANDAGGRCALRHSGDAHRQGSGSYRTPTSCASAPRAASADRDAQAVLGATPQSERPAAGSGTGVFAHPCPLPLGSLPASDPSGKGAGPMRATTLAIIGGAVGAAGAQALKAPLPGTGDNPALDLIAYHDPGFHTVIRVWYYTWPAVAVVLAGSFTLSVWRVWFQPRAGGGGRGTLPPWPASPDDEAPSLVIGELHHPTVAAGERAAVLARHPREGALHRRVRRRSRRHRQDHRLHVPVRGASSSPGRPTIPAAGRARSCSRSRVTSVIKCGASSRTPGAAATTSKSGSAARGSGTRSTIRSSTPTRSPTASPPSSTSSSARAGSRFGSRRTRTSCAGSSNCTGCCRGAGSRSGTSTAARSTWSSWLGRSARPGSYAQCGPPSPTRTSPLTSRSSRVGPGSWRPGPREWDVDSIRP